MPAGSFSETLEEKSIYDFSLSIGRCIGHTASPPVLAEGLT